MLRPVAVGVLFLLAATARGSIADDIRSLAQLHTEGLLTDAEYATAKSRALAAAFPERRGASQNSSQYVTIDCIDSGDKKVLTVVLTDSATPLDLRQQSVCPEVVGYSGYTTQLVPVHIPQ